jgi:hypothetical protein
VRWSAAQFDAYQARRAAPPSAANLKNNQARARQSKLPATPEAVSHLAIVDHLRTRCRRGVHWHHPATGELRDPVTAAKLQRMGVRAGLPDFLFVIGGRLHGLELKRERGGRVSPEQHAMHSELRAAGAVVEVARGLDDALAILAGWHVFADSHNRERTTGNE